MDLDRDDLNAAAEDEEGVADEHDEPMPEYEEDRNSLRHRQQSFQDELARTKAKLAEMPRGWEARGVSGREWDETSEGLTPQHVRGVANASRPDAAARKTPETPQVLGRRRAPRRQLTW